MVRYPKQHRQLPVSSSYRADFSKPVGLHPKHNLHLSNIESPDQHCRLYSKYTIPKALFVDKYQLADLDRSTAMSTAKGKLIAVWGETDLEAPVWSVDGWGSELLVEIYHNSDIQSSDFTFELPLHSRYEFPQMNSTSVTQNLPWPIVFWVCPDFQQEQRHIGEIKGLGYESLFPDNTLYYHLTPSPEDGDVLSTSFNIPVAPFNQYDRIQWLSVTVLLTATIYILYKIVSNIGRKTKAD
ncbi:Pbn1p [Sugiyamaella lignohabitans]|uniref:Protein PBN1 n=1 Tax=Sugiyamaella lignohabitans TaxID=796027 RepID=A0A161HJJ0_9ASCO|nr:Pbn1p [Sugiyamaella lignohabitans]ANB11588.1 Pbn1p [Sugiyamaella lignohabitans]